MLWHAGVAESYALIGIFIIIKNRLAGAALLYVHQQLKFLKEVQETLFDFLIAFLASLLVSEDNFRQNKLLH